MGVWTIQPLGWSEHLTPACWGDESPDPMPGSLMLKPPRAPTIHFQGTILVPHHASGLEARDTDEKAEDCRKTMMLSKREGTSPYWGLYL